MKRLVILNRGPDTAGCGIRLKQAFDRYAPDWEARAVCRQKLYLDYPTDIYWPRDSPNRLKRQVIQLVREADVIHVMDLESAISPFVPWLKRQKIIFHHLGTHFRRDPAAISEICQSYGGTEVTDSIDLMVFPHIRFLPVTSDTEALAKLRQDRYRPSKRIRIAHAPTHREIKSTEQIRAAVRKLARHYPIDFDLIEGVSNRECLERKAQADIFIDQLLLGFGVNNIECWAMGIPVVSGLVDPDARSKAFELWGELPWADATEQTLESVVEHLVTDPEWRANLGARGKAHGERWHSQRSVVEQTLAVYARAGLSVAA